MRTRYQTGGKLYEDGDDRWMFRYWEDVLDSQGQPVLVDGKPKRTRKKYLLSKKNYPKKALALKEQARVMARVNREDHKPDSEITFGEFAQKWQDEVLTNRAPSTQDQAKKELRFYFLPKFASTQMVQITDEAVQKWVNSLKLGPKSKQNLRAIGSSMWGKAIKWGYATDNPFTSLDLPTVDPSSVYQFSAEEMLAIVQEAKQITYSGVTANRKGTLVTIPPRKAPEWYSLFFELLAHTGMRPGEAAGLRAEDIQGRRIYVCQSVWRGKIKLPKTRTSLRNFTVSQRLADSLREHIAASGPNNHGLVFVTRERKPLCLHSFNEFVLRPILKKLGIWEKAKTKNQRAGLYAFRHGNMTEQHRNGVPLKTIQARVGHVSGSEVTMRHYIHADSADDVMASDLMEAILGPKNDKEAIQ